jgi:hypothetical protein
MPKAGHFYCDVCMMPFEDNAHLQRHSGTNKHINTLLKKRGINIDEVDMDEIVDISKLSQEELKQYVINTDRFNELYHCNDVIQRFTNMQKRKDEINDILGEEQRSYKSINEDDPNNSGDDDDDKITSRATFNFPQSQLDIEERRILLDEKETLFIRIYEMNGLYGGEDKIVKIRNYAIETVIKELRTEYLTFIKMKEKRLEKERKDAEKQAKEDERQAEKDKRQAEKDEARRKKDAMNMMILQAKLGMLNQ